MQTVTFRAQHSLCAGIQRRICACLMAMLVVGFFAHNAKASFEDDSAAGASSSDFTGADGGASGQSGQSIDFTVNSLGQVSGVDMADLSLTGRGSDSAMDMADMPILADASGMDGGSMGGSTGGSSGGSTGGTSSSSFSIGNTAVVLPEPASLSLIALGGLGLFARCRRNATRAL